MRMLGIATFLFALSAGATEIPYIDVAGTLHLEEGSITQGSCVRHMQSVTNENGGCKVRIIVFENENFKETFNQKLTKDFREAYTTAEKFYLAPFYAGAWLADEWNCLKMKSELAQELKAHGFLCYNEIDLDNWKAVPDHYNLMDLTREGVPPAEL